jgi:RNase P subunit RPR2
MKKLSKTETEQKITEFFKDAENKSEKDIKKIKRIAMNNNIPLKNLRKKFCKKCYSFLKGKTRINNNIKSITCENCGYVNRWRIKN